MSHGSPSPCISVLLEKPILKKGLVCVQGDVVQKGGGEMVGVGVLLTPGPVRG